MQTHSLHTTRTALSFITYEYLNMINKQWEVIALEELTSHIEQAQQQRPELPTITPPGIREIQGT